MDTLVHPSGRETQLVNTNRLIKYYDKCKTGKTGFTDEAGYCLASTASNSNLNLIAVVLKCDKAQDRFKESVDLYNYGFANFENKKIIDVNSPIDSIIKVSGGKEDVVGLRYANDYSVVCRKGDSSSYSIDISNISTIKAPQKAGQKVGTATILKDGKIIAATSLNLGTVRLKELFYDKGDFKGATQFIKDKINALNGEFKSEQIVAIGGSLRAISKAIMERSNYAYKVLHGFCYELRKEGAFIKKIANAKPNDLKELCIK